MVEGRPRRVPLVVIVASSAAAALGWFSAISFATESNLNAAQQFQEAAVITAVVIEDLVEPELILRGDVKRESLVQLQLPEPPTLPGATAGIFTRLPTAGEEIAAGQVLVEVSGRPVVVMTGSFPIQRDLIMGLEGPDVTTWQQLLAEKGFLTSADIDSSFGPITAEATADFYASLGYSVAAHPLHDEFALLRLELDLEEAAFQVEIATKTCKDAVKRRAPAAEIAQARRDLLRAELVRAQTEAELSQLRSFAEPWLPMNEVALVSALPATVVNVDARLGEDVAEQTSILSLQSGRVFLEVGGPDVPSLVVGQVVTVPELGAESGEVVDGVVTEVRLDLDAPIAIVDFSSSTFASWVGTNVAVRVQRTTNETALSVPASAITVDAEGRTFIEVRIADANEKVLVTTGPETASGGIAVESGDSRLQEGAHVVVGFQR